MSNNKLLVLSRAAVEPLVGLREAIPVVEKALADLASERALLFPVIRERINPYDGFFGVKAAYLESQGYLGFKGGGYWKDNRSHGLEGHQSVILLYHPATGVPLAIIDGNYLTVLRTGAVGAIAAKYLARRDSRIVAVIGCGVQGRIQLDGLRQVLEIEQVRCCGRSAESTRRFALACSRTGLEAIPCSNAQEAVQGADVIVTATPSFEPIINDAWVSPGVHVNAIGSDTVGKQELDEKLLGRSKVVVDSWAQAARLGECQHAVRTGLLRSAQAELGSVIAGRERGRERDDEITIFDSTGLAIQDLAVAAYAYEVARSRDVGHYVEMD